MFPRLIQKTLVLMKSVWLKEKSKASLIQLDQYQLRELFQSFDALSVRRPGSFVRTTSRTKSRTSMQFFFMLPVRFVLRLNWRCFLAR